MGKIPMSKLHDILNYLGDSSSIEYHIIPEFIWCSILTALPPRPTLSSRSFSQAFFFLCSCLVEILFYNFFSYVSSLFIDEWLPHLIAKTNCGENIEDEWFIVFLLLEFSKKFPDIAIR